MHDTTTTAKYLLLYISNTRLFGAARAFSLSILSMHASLEVFFRGEGITFVFHRRHSSAPNMNCAQIDRAKTVKVESRYLSMPGSQGFTPHTYVVFDNIDESSSRLHVRVRSDRYDMCVSVCVCVANFVRPQCSKLTARWLVNTADTQQTCTHKQNSLACHAAGGVNCA